MLNQRHIVSSIDIKALPTLTEGEADSLIERIREGDKSARERFALGNMRLVLSAVNGFSGKRYSADDMFQSGCIGLMKAIDNFDPAVGVRFSTYAVPMIIGEIRRAIRRDSPLRVSRSVRDLAYRAIGAREEFSRIRGREPSVKELSEILMRDERDIIEALDAIADPISLFEPLGEDRDTTLCDRLEDEEQESFIDRIAIDHALEKCSEREKKLIILRYYRGKTQSETSKLLGISQAQVSRLEKSVVSTLRKYLT